MDVLQQQILDLLGGTTTPAGAGALLSAMRDRGVAISQATLGRALRALDEQSLTVKVSNKGRVITPDGTRWLAEARQRETATRWTEETLMAVGQSTLTELRQAMIARRALEREIARLAAENATPGEIAELRRIVENQAQNIQVGGHGATEAVDFHVALARVCGNRFLTAAVSLVRNTSRVLETLMYHLGATVGTSFNSHSQLVEAVASRDPQAAEEAIVGHLDELITDIDALLARLDKEASTRDTRAEAAKGEQSKAQNNGRMGRLSGLAIEG
jgi:GntR family transcriptional repressor for pyruvate dehydrogenase complex